jgi:hypothetical protein
MTLFWVTVIYCVIKSPVLLTRQLNTISGHSRLSGIERLNILNIKKDSGQAGMTKLNNLLAGLIVVFYQLIIDAGNLSFPAIPMN